MDLLSFCYPKRTHWYVLYYPYAEDQQERYLMWSCLELRALLFVGISD
jgi:hypothetical protein